MLPRFSFDNLLDIPPTDALGASAFLPFGVAGVLAALVYGIWFFLAVEGVPLAAEEASDPKRDMPRGIIAAMLVLLVFAALMLFVGPGAAGSSAIQDSDNPLPLAIRAAYGGDTCSPSSSTTSGWPGWSLASSRSSTPTRGSCSRCPEPATCPRLSLTGGARRPTWR